MRRGAWITVALVLCAAGARADGGHVRLRQDAGPFAITVFTAPEPLTAGPVDVSVLVQDLATGRPLLDTDVEILLRAPDGDGDRNAIATPGANRVLKAVAMDLPKPGTWHVEVRVRRSGQTVTVTAVLPVGPPASRLFGIWPYLATPPVAIVLFAMRAVGQRRRRNQ